MAGFEQKEESALGMYAKLLSFEGPDGQWHPDALKTASGLVFIDGDAVPVRALMFTTADGATHEFFGDEDQFGALGAVSLLMYTSEHMRECPDGGNTSECAISMIHAMVLGLLHLKWGLAVEDDR